jgi:hypothetical protein
MPFVAGKSSSLSFVVVRRGALDLGKGILINHLMTGLGNSFSSGGSVNLCLSPWHSLVPFRFLRRVDVGVSLSMTLLTSLRQVDMVGISQG